MSEIKITATKREMGDSVKQLRAQGILPGILYGHKTANVVLKVPTKDFHKVYKEAGVNTLIDLQVENDTSVKVLIHDVAHDGVTDEPIHVDFYQVKMDEPIHAEIPLEYVHEAPAVRELGGVLVKQLDVLPVKCLPQDLIKSIQVDLSSLAEFDNVIRMEDLTIPSNIEVLKEPIQVIAVVTPPRVEEKPEQSAEEDITEEEGKEAAIAPSDSTGEEEKKESGNVVSTTHK